MFLSNDADGYMTELDVKVVDVSYDTIAEQKAFSDKFKLPFTLIADKNGKVVWHDPKAATDTQAD